MITYGKKPPEVIEQEEAQIPVADVNLDAAELPDRRWTLAVQAYAELLGLDSQYLDAWVEYRGARVSLAEKTWDEREAKGALAQVELEILAEIKPKDSRLVAAGAAKDRERVLKTIVATDERMLDAQKALSGAVAALENATASYDISRKRLTYLERRMSWRNQWMAFLSSIRPIPDVGEPPEDFDLDKIPEIPFDNS
jgi:hypothetical protein